MASSSLSDRMYMDLPPTPSPTQDFYSFDDHLDALCEQQDDSFLVVQCFSAYDEAVEYFQATPRPSTNAFQNSPNPGTGRQRAVSNSSIKPVANNTFAGVVAAGSIGHGDLTAAASELSEREARFAYIRYEGHLVLVQCLPKTTNLVKRGKAIASGKNLTAQVPGVEAVITIADPSQLTNDLLKGKLRLDSQSKASGFFDAFRRTSESNDGLNRSHSRASAWSSTDSVFSTLNSRARGVIKNLKDATTRRPHAPPSSFRADKVPAEPRVAISGRRSAHCPADVESSNDWDLPWRGYKHGKSQSDASLAPQKARELAVQSCPPVVDDASDEILTMSEEQLQTDSQGDPETWITGVENFASDLFLGSSMESLVENRRNEVRRQSAARVSSDLNSIDSLLVRSLSSTSSFGNDLHMRGDSSVSVTQDTHRTGDSSIIKPHMFSVTGEHDMSENDQHEWRRIQQEIDNMRERQQSVENPPIHRTAQGHAVENAVIQRKTLHSKHPSDSTPDEEPGSDSFEGVIVVGFDKASPAQTSSGTQSMASLSQGHHARTNSTAPSLPPRDPLPVVPAPAVVNRRRGASMPTTPSPLKSTFDNVEIKKVIPLAAVEAVSYGKEQQPPPTTWSSRQAEEAGQPVSRSAQKLSRDATPLFSLFSKYAANPTPAREPPASSSAYNNPLLTPLGPIPAPKPFMALAELSTSSTSLVSSGMYSLTGDTSPRLTSMPAKRKSIGSGWKLSEVEGRPVGFGITLEKDLPMLPEPTIDWTLDAIPTTARLRRSPSFTFEAEPPVESKRLSAIAARRGSGSAARTKIMGLKSIFGTPRQMSSTLRVPQFMTPTRGRTSPYSPNAWSRTSAEVGDAQHNPLSSFRIHRKHAPSPQPSEIKETSQDAEPWSMQLEEMQKQRLSLCDDIAQLTQQISRRETIEKLRRARWLAEANHRLRLDAFERSQVETAERVHCASVVEAQEYDKHRRQQLCEQRIDCERWIQDEQERLVLDGKARLERDAKLRELHERKVREEFEQRTRREGRARSHGSIRRQLEDRLRSDPAGAIMAGFITVQATGTLWKRRWLELYVDSLNLYLEERSDSSPQLRAERERLRPRQWLQRRNTPSPRPPMPAIAPVEKIELGGKSVVSLDRAFEEVQVSHSFALRYRATAASKSEHRIAQQHSHSASIETMYAFMDDAGSTERLVVALSMLTGQRIPEL